MCAWRLGSSLFVVGILSAMWDLVACMCPVKCNCLDEKLIVMCKDASLDIVPITLNPELTELHLANNQIKTIMTSFSVYRSLEFLDISENQLVTLGKKNFFMQKKLRVLLLSKNRISSLQNQTFTGLSSLQMLNMNDNYLQEIPPTVFAGLSKLEYLDLSRNRISSISNEAFAGLVNLRSLFLRDNKLSELPTTSFYYLPSLLRLDIGMNSIAKLGEYGFTPLNYLEELNLDMCGIQTIEPGCFKHMNSLLTLHIQDNELQEIPTEALSDLKYLEALNIGQPSLQKLGPHSFRGLNNLRMLIISGANELEAIESLCLADNRHLEKIVLEHNRKLSRIDPDVFAHLSGLRYLSLRGNAFETFDESLVSWKDIDYIDVRDNNLVCNCSLLWLKILLKRENHTKFANLETSHVLCSEPPHLRNNLLLALTEDDLGCNLITFYQIIIGGLVITCVCTVALICIAIWCRTKFFLRHKDCYSDIPENYYLQRNIPTTTVVVHPRFANTPVNEL